MVTLITGSLEGNFQLGSWGQLYALSDSQIDIFGTIGSASFTLPRSSVFGAVALNGSSPFPNSINGITVYGQGVILAVETTATGGGGGGTPGTGSALFSDVVIGTSPTGSEGNWKLVTSGSNLEFQFWDSASASWITDTFLDGTPYSGSSFNYLTLQDVVAGPGITLNSGSGLLEISSSASSIDTGSFLTTSSFNEFTSSVVSTASFNEFTSSVFTTASLDTGSFVLTSSFNDFTGSYNTGSFTGSFIGIATTASYVSGSILNYPDPFTSTAAVDTIVTLTNAEYTALGTKDPNALYVIVG